MKRYLIEALGIADPPNSPEPVLRRANDSGLLAVPLAQWFRYADARAGLFHDYDGIKAQACLALVPDFIDDATGLYQKMSGPGPL